MIVFRSALLGAVLVVASLGNAVAQEAIRSRTELKRADLTGTNMEVIISLSEIKPGESSPRHFHHGEEAIYLLEGATAELADGTQRQSVAGTASINVRDVTHGE